MGNAKSKKSSKDLGLFDWERRKEIKREKNKKKRVDPTKKRWGIIEPPATPTNLSSTPPPPPSSIKVEPPPTHLRTYDDEALDMMRYQLHCDADAFLLNNILLSVQFFNNYESEMDHIKNNPIGDREQMINTAMVQHHKHVFFADRLQECVHEHVSFQKTGSQTEPLVAPRLFVIYDNVEPSEPGDISDYSIVLDAPFYKLCIQDSKEPGYVKLQKLEVLKSTLSQANENGNKIELDDSVYTDSEKESISSDDFSEPIGGKELLEKIKNKLNATHTKDCFPKEKNGIINMDPVEGRRPSGPMLQKSLQVQKNNISNINKFKKKFQTLHEDTNKNELSNSEASKEVFIGNEKPRKSNLKNIKRFSGPVKEVKSIAFVTDIKTKAFVTDTIAEDTETSGYRSNSGSRQNEYSESESDYGYSTITQSTTPKKIELSVQSNTSLTSGVLPEESWSAVDLRIDNWNDDDEEEQEGNDFLANTLDSRNLYETKYYLSSLGFMKNFIDIFITDLGSSLGLTEEVVNNALTQGASIYCNRLKNGQQVGCEIFPALVAAWPNAANQFIIRERKIIQNPRTNLSYQWPTKQMVRRAIELGCFLVPLGFRLKRGQNPEQKLEWKITFPAAERYLEKFLAHSHVRCYLFALTLHRAFMEIEASKICLDVNHIKHHLFWQCEDNFAKWPEDRLGETLRSFLRTFYIRFSQNRLPNYFISNCNEFKSIPKPLLLKIQRKLADILEAPVTHMLHSLSKVKYHKKEFYPKFNSHRLYDILTCKNPLRIINPNLPAAVLSYSDSSDGEEENGLNLWDKAKVKDKEYLWKKEQQKRLEAEKKKKERRRKALYSNKQKSGASREKELNPNVKLPAKMDVERRRLVLEFFIPHFIAMARSSEKFEAIGQAIIYLEQAQRLCMLLLHEPAGDTTANEYLEVIRDKLADCQRKLAKQGGYKLPPRVSTNIERPLRKIRNRPRFDKIHSNSPTDSPGIPAFSFIDVHMEESKKNVTLKLNDESDISDEESKL